MRTRSQTHRFPYPVVDAWTFVRAPPRQQQPALAINDLPDLALTLVMEHVNIHDIRSLRLASRAMRTIVDAHVPVASMDGNRLIGPMNDAEGYRVVYLCIRIRHSVRELHVKHVDSTSRAVALACLPDDMLQRVRFQFREQHK